MQAVSFGLREILSSAYLILRDLERIILYFVSFDIPILVLDEPDCPFEVGLQTENISIGVEMNSLDLYWASSIRYLLMIYRFYSKDFFEFGESFWVILGNLLSSLLFLFRYDLKACLSFKGILGLLES